MKYLKILLYYLNLNYVAFKKHSESRNSTRTASVSHQPMIVIVQAVVK